jgi:hypothetical protein
MIAEKTYRPLSGWLPLIVTIALLLGGPTAIVFGIIGLNVDPGLTAALMLTGGILLTIAGSIAIFGFMAIAPNQARVLLLFGTYKGSALESGFFWVNPFFTKKKISLRVRNFETGSTHTPEKKSAEGAVVEKAHRSAGRHPRSTTATAIPSISRQWSCGG